MQKSRCFTCRDMLKLNSMTGSVVLAGEKNLDSRILRVNTVEVPDIINWVGEREMLITTGYPFKDNKEKIAEMIPLLVAKKVVGMAIKPKRFIDEIPESVISVARQYNFIVISLSPDAVFSSIVRESLEQILAKEMVLMTAAHKITEDVICAAAESPEDSRLEKALEVFSGQTGSLSFIISNHDTVIKPSDIAVPAVLSEIDTTDGSDVTVRDGDSVYCCMVHRLGAVADNTFFVCAVRNSEFSEIALMAVDRVIQVLSLEFNQMKTLKRIQSRYRSRYVAEWITGGFLSEEDICVSAEAYSIKLYPEKNYRTVVISCRDDTRIEFDLLERINSALAKLHRAYYPAFIDSHAVIVMESEFEEPAADLAELLEKLNMTLNSDGFRLCVSERTAVGEMPKAYDQAHRICMICEKCGLDKHLITCRDLGVYEILALLPEDKAIDEFVDRLISPLAEYDQNHSSDFLGTLRCYYDAGSNIKAAADRLFTHYNTVCYRLDRIRSILGLDIDDVETRFQIQTALILYKINGLKEDNE